MLLTHKIVQLLRFVTGIGKLATKNHRHWGANISHKIGRRCSCLVCKCPRSSRVESDLHCNLSSPVGQHRPGAGTDGHHGVPAGADDQILRAVWKGRESSDDSLASKCE